MTGRNTNPTIERKELRWWIFVYLCQSPWNPHPLQKFTVLCSWIGPCRNHTHESRGASCYFCGRAKGNSKSFGRSLSSLLVSQLGYPSPTTFSNPIESDTSHRGKKSPTSFSLLFCKRAIESSFGDKIHSNIIHVLDPKLHRIRGFKSTKTIEIRHKIAKMSSLSHLKSAFKYNPNYETLLLQWLFCFLDP